MRRDLAAVATFACLALVVALAPAPVWLRSVLLLPLVLILPGYALAARFFGPGSVSPAERGAYAVTLSIAVAAFAGLLAQVAIGLDRTVWALLLAGFTVAVVLSAPPRETGGEAARPLARPWGLPLATAAFLTAAAVAALAVVSATDNLHEAQARIRFTGFWMLPGKAGPESVAVGIASHEGKPTRYVMSVARGGRTVARTPIALRGGERWEREFSLPPGGARAVATLTREGRPYRRLGLESR